MFSLMPMTALRAMREPPMPPLMPSTSMVCSSPWPTSDITVIRMSSPGKAIQASTNRCTTISSLPPKNPVVVPISIATTMLILVAARPTTSDTRAP